MAGLIGLVPSTKRLSVVAEIEEFGLIGYKAWSYDSDVYQRDDESSYLGAFASVSLAVKAIRDDRASKGLEPIYFSWADVLRRDEPTRACYTSQDD